MSHGGRPVHLTLQCPAPDATPWPPYAYGPGFSLGLLRWTEGGTELPLHPSRASSATDRSCTLFKFPGTSPTAGRSSVRGTVGIHSRMQARRGVFMIGNPELSTATDHATSRWTIHRNPCRARVSTPNQRPAGPLGSTIGGVVVITDHPYSHR